MEFFHGGWEHDDQRERKELDVQAQLVMTAQRVIMGQNMDFHQTAIRYNPGASRYDRFKYKLLPWNERSQLRSF